MIAKFIPPDDLAQQVQPLILALFALVLRRLVSWSLVSLILVLTSLVSLTQVLTSLVLPTSASKTPLFRRDLSQVLVPPSPTSSDLGLFVGLVHAVEQRLPLGQLLLFLRIASTVAGTQVPSKNFDFGLFLLCQWYAGPLKNHILHNKYSSIIDHLLMRGQI